MEELVELIPLLKARQFRQEFVVGIIKVVVEPPKYSSNTQFVLAVTVK